MPNMHCTIASPLLQGKTEKNRVTCFANMSPFWAVPKEKQGSDESNMILETAVFSAQAPITETSAKFPKLSTGTKFHVSVEFMRNRKHIGAGEVLTLPNPFDTTTV